MQAELLPSPDDDAGQATPLMAAAVGLVAVMLLALGPMGRALADRAQARTAADAAALAGAVDGEAAARDVARANGAELTTFTDRGGGEIVVEVSIDGVAAQARARPVVAPSGPGTGAGSGGAGGGDRSGLAPSMRAALAAAEQRLGRPVPIVSGFRSPAQQQALWERRGSNPFPVAPPGRSLHERGLAIDVPRNFVDDLLRISDQVGLCQPLPQTDPIHFVVCGS